MYKSISGTYINVCSLTVQCPIETEIWEIDDEPGQKSIFSDDPAVVKSAVEKAFYNTDLLPKKLWVCSLGYNLKRKLNMHIRV